jgi:hypothetical protein
MKVLGMTGGILAFALLCGVVIGVAMSFGSIPHPVEVPVQVITPVPTPEPVIITEHPTPAPVQQPVQQSSPWNATGMENPIADAFGLIKIMMVILPITFVIFFMLQLTKGDRGGDMY